MSAFSIEIMVLGFVIGFVATHIVLRVYYDRKRVELLKTLKEGR